MSSTWSEGYVTDVGYTFGYYPELNPLRVRLALLSGGCIPPSIGHACELGFGQGVTVNMHSVDPAVEWYGTDFAPSQVAFARRLASSDTVANRLSASSFQDYIHLSHLPDLDFICLHGIFSWISDANKIAIVDFIDKKLKVGGVVYVSYNTLPGWTALLPLRELFSEFARGGVASHTDVISRMEATLAFTQKVIDTNPAYTRAHPVVLERFNTILKQPKTYLAHEYLNGNWNPMSFPQMHSWMSQARLDYVCSANLVEHIDDLHLNAAQKEMLAATADPVFRQFLRDIFTNQAFRKDLWIKGARRPGQQAIDLLWRDLHFMLIRHREDIPRKIQGTISEGELGPIYDGVIALLEAEGPVSFGRLADELATKGVLVAALKQMLLVLISLGAVAVVNDEMSADRAAPSSATLNRKIVDLAVLGGDISYVSSPLTAGAVGLGRFDQLFLRAHCAGATTPQACAESVWAILVSQGQKLMKDGVVLEAVEDNLAELTSQAESFLSRQLPLLERLAVNVAPA